MPTAARAVEIQREELTRPDALIALIESAFFASSDARAAGANAFVPLRDLVCSVATSRVTMPEGLPALEPRRAAQLRQSAMTRRSCATLIIRSPATRGPTSARPSDQAQKKRLRRGAGSSAISRARADSNYRRPGRRASSAGSSAEAARRRIAFAERARPPRLQPIRTSGAGTFHPSPSSTLGRARARRASSVKQSLKGSQQRSSRALRAMQPGVVIPAEGTLRRGDRERCLRGSAWEPRSVSPCETSSLLALRPARRWFSLRHR